MLSLRELQKSFAHSTFAWAHPPLLSVRDSGGARLEIYRNNVFSNYRRALQDVYPVVARLTGAAFFRRAAESYIRALPSVSGDLHQYGGSFAEFLETFPGAEGLVYLPDVARLEWLLHETFHAADARPLRLETLAALGSEAYPRLVFKLAPACRLLESVYPVARIWEVNQPGYSGADTVDLAAGGVRLLLKRGAFEVAMEKLQEDEFALLARLHAGEEFGPACEEILAAHPAFDAAAFLQRHVVQATLVDFELSD
ncbi:MAG: HvfC/BufC family peptide modification chaperone [Burkholderiales bacterium]